MAFKIKHVLYIASGSAPPAEKEKSGVRQYPLLILIILCSVSKNSEIKLLPSKPHGRHGRHGPNHTTRPVWTTISSAHLPFPVLGHHILLNTHFSYTSNLQSSLKPQDRVTQSTQNKMIKLLLSHARTHTVLSFQALENQNRREECSYSSILTGGKSRHWYSCAVRTKAPCMSYCHLEISKSDNQDSVPAPFGINGIILFLLLNAPYFFKGGD